MIARKSARDKGTRWNRAIAEYLVAEGWPHAEVRAKNGAFDRGDVTGVAGVMIEAKNEARPRLSEYMAEVIVQRANAKAVVGVAWVKRLGYSNAADGLVLMHQPTYEDLAALRMPTYFVGPYPLAEVLARTPLWPLRADEAFLLRRNKTSLGVAGVSGSMFVQLLREGGFQ